MDLIEREPFFDTLTTLLAEAARGSGRLVLLGGEAGAGKSVFVQELGRRLGETARTLVGACDPLSTPRPLAPLADVAPLLGGELAQLLHAEAPREQLFTALLAQLSVGSRPQVLVFEDLHWADEATLDLVRFLGRRLGRTRTLLLATYRDDEVGPGHPLRVALGDLGTATAVRRLTLPPLSKAGVRLLAGTSTLDPALLYRQTGGNPFFVTEVLASDAPGIPATVRDAVLARMARLSTEGQAALEAAAVIGARAETWLLETVLGEQAAALDECLAAGMLQSADELLAFRHELARQAVLEALSPLRRTALHRTVLAALRPHADAPEMLARLAHHAEAAGDQGAVLEYAPRAARQAAGLKAHREAAAQYRRALRYAAALAPSERAALLEALAYECYLTARHSDAIEAWQAALAIWRDVGDQRREGNSLRWLSRGWWFLGRKSDADTAAEAALRLLEPLGPGRELAWAYSNLAQLRMLEQANDVAISLGEKAAELAERLHDTELLVHALNNIGTAHSRGDERGHAELVRSLELARAADIEEHAARAYANIVSGDIQRCRLARAEAYLEEGLAYCLDHDLDTWRLYLLSWCAVQRLLQGRWAEAADLATSVLRHPGVSPITGIQALTVIGRVRARRGDPEVDTALDEALALALPTEELQRIGPVRAARAEAAWLAGQPERAATEADAALGLARDHNNDWLAGELAFWLWRCDALTELPDGAAEPHALQISGDWAAAAARWDALGCPYEAAQARLDGDEPALRAALAAFERLGARPAAATAARRLRERGARGIPRGPRPATQGNSGGLTAREVEIWRLLGEGLRNAEIAERLVLSPKTVDHHVSAILAKLGVHSRAEAARVSLCIQPE